MGAQVRAYSLCGDMASRSTQRANAPGLRLSAGSLCPTRRDGTLYIELLAVNTPYLPTLARSPIPRRPLRRQPHTPLKFIVAGHRAADLGPILADERPNSGWGHWNTTLVSRHKAIHRS